MDSKTETIQKGELTLEDKFEIYEETLQKGSLNSDKDISKIPLLNKEEEIEIAKKIEEGQEHYKKYLFAANLRLVRKIADEISFKTSRYHNFGQEDLRQEGYCGLIRAVEKFDYKLGYKFSTYATYWITQGITRSIEDNGKDIRYPYHYYTTYTKLEKIRESLSTKLGREPKDEELTEAMNIGEQNLLLSRKRVSQSFVSLDKSISHEDGESSLKEILEDPNSTNPEEEALKNIDYKKTTEMLENLSERERKILEERFGLNGYRRKTLDELGKDYNLSRERIRAIEERAIRKLRVVMIKENFNIINNVMKTLSKDDRHLLEFRLGLRNGKKERHMNSADRIKEIEERILKELAANHLF